MAYLTRLIAAAAIAAVPSAAFAQDWRLVVRIDGRSDFVDASNVRRSGATVRFQTERRLDTPFNLGRIDVDLVSELYEANCTDLSYIPLQRVGYLAGRVVLPAYRPSETIRRAAPGTVIATLIEFACATEVRRVDEAAIAS